MTKAILFDSDGLLLDSERLFFEATCSAFNQAGVNLSSTHWSQWFLSEGKHSHEIAGMLGIDLALVPSLIQKRDALFWDLVDRGVPLFPGVRETLTQLSLHFKLAVVTGASRQHFDRVHAANGIDSFFSRVITSDDYEHAKPHPQAYLTALKMLDLHPSECLAVEDSPRGAAAAVSAGIKCVIIPTYLTNVSLCPPEGVVLDNITQLTELDAIKQIGFL